VKKTVIALVLVLAAVLAYGLLIGNHHPTSRWPAGFELAQPAAAPSTQSLYRKSPEERAREARLAECEIAISWSSAQHRREVACETEVFANFKRGDWDPPALRAGRFR
jgi:hypothetical protein